MWQFGLMASVVSKFIIDKDRMDPELRAKIKKITKNITEYGELVNSLDVTNPISWVTTASTAVDKFYGPTQDQAIINPQLEEKILKEFGMVEFASFELAQCLEILISNYNHKFIDLYDGAEIEATKIRPGYYHFDIDGRSLGCFYSEYDDRTYYLPKDIRVEGFKYAREHFLDLLSDVSKKIWGDNKALVLSSREGESSYEEVSVNPFNIDEHEYWGPLESLAERWPKYREAKIRRTCIVQGKPGTGKTTFAYWLARKISKRTLIFDGQYISETTNQDITDAITFLRPEMIILNDIHYMSTDRLQTTLAVFEEGASDLMVPYIVCTSNDMEMIPKPLQRPGRLGDEIYIVDDMVMSDEVRRKIITGFENKVDYKIPEDLQDDFFNIYKSVSQSEAFLVEIMKRAKVEGEEVLYKYVEQELKRIEEDPDEDCFEDDEYYEDDEY
jgi:hypothetical protein